MSAGDGSLTPVSGPDLTKYLQDVHSAVLSRQVGSHIHFRLPDGRRVGSLSHGQIPASMLRDVAGVLGFTYQRLRSDLGAPVVARGRGKPTPAAPVRREASRGDVLGLLAELNDATRRIHQTLNGQRDPAHYRRITDTIRPALRRIGGAVDIAEGRS